MPNRPILQLRFIRHQQKEKNMSIKYDNDKRNHEDLVIKQAEKLSKNGLFKPKTSNPIDNLEAISDKTLDKINPNDAPGDWFVKVNWAYG